MIEGNTIGDYQKVVKTENKEDISRQEKQRAISASEVEVKDIARHYQKDKGLEIMRQRNLSQPCPLPCISIPTTSNASLDGTLWKLSGNRSRFPRLESDAFRSVGLSDFPGVQIYIWILCQIMDIL